MTRLINSLYEHVGDRGVYQGDKLELNGLITRKGLGKDEVLYKYMTKLIISEKTRFGGEKVETTEIRTVAENA
jgi:hypothetical protein